MISARTTRSLAALACAACAAACGPKRSTSAPERPAEAQAVLLADADTRVAGSVRVFNDHGSVDLDADRESTTVRANSAPGPVTVMSESDVQRIFGEALSALPPALRRFTLFFRFESDELTDASRSQLQEVVTAVRGRPAPEVSIVGHTDTAGSPSANVQLGLKRANAVRSLLVSAGLDASVVEATSHGEADLLIPTPDDTAEQRNRRVEISVR